MLASVSQKAFIGFGVLLVDFDVASWLATGWAWGCGEVCCSIASWTGSWIGCADKVHGKCGQGTYPLKCPGTLRIGRRVRSIQECGRPYPVTGIISVDLGILLEKLKILGSLETCVYLVVPAFPRPWHRSRHRRVCWILSWLGKASIISERLAMEGAKVSFFSRSVCVSCLSD